MLVSVHSIMVIELPSCHCHWHAISSIFVKFLVEFMRSENRSGDPLNKTEMRKNTRKIERIKIRFLGTPT